MQKLSIGPDASIIIPAFNAAATIGRALQGARSQTAADIEIIMVDDGSSDETASIFSDAAGDDPRFRCIRHKSCQGPSAARNTALDAARGRWIALLDADDWMVKTRIQDMILQAEARGLDLLADNLVLVDAETAKVVGTALDPKLMTITHDLALADMLRADWPGKKGSFRGFGVAKPIIRRSFLEDRGLRYDPSVRLGEDLLLYCSVAASGGRVGVTPQSGYHYTTNAQTLSQLRAPTMELVLVNEKIRCAVAQADAKAFGGVLQLLLDRDAALRFQVFTWALKVFDVSLAIRIATSIPPFSLIRLSGRKIRELVMAAAKARPATGHATSCPS